MKIDHNAFDIGNDIQIVWPILMDGHEMDLQEQPITMTIVAPNGRKRDLDFEVDGNVLMTEFLAVDQKETGWYHLEVCYNRGMRGMKTVYAPNALLLRNPYKCPHAGGNSLNSERLMMPTAYLQVGLALNGVDQKVENLTSHVEDIRAEVDSQKLLNDQQQEQIDKNTADNSSQQEQIDKNTADNASQQEQIEKNAADNTSQQEQIDANTEMNRLQEEGIGEQAAQELINGIFGS